MPEKNNLKGSNKRFFLAVLKHCTFLTTVSVSALNIITLSGCIKLECRTQLLKKFLYKQISDYDEV